MEESAIKQYGGKRKNSGRKKGKTKTTKTFRIDDDLCEYLESKVGNQNAFINMLIRLYKENSEALIKKIDKILEQEK
jgi:hypothetical protein